MGTRGGKREGAGKPKGSKASHTLRAQELKKRLIERFHIESDSIYSALIDKAKAGDIPAIRELLDRVWGKSPQSIETPDIKEALKIIFDDSFTQTTKENSPK